MNVYEAIMRAAAEIESDPKKFDFGSVNFPDCGSPGCALGWIGHFLGYRETPGQSVLAVCKDLGVYAPNHCNCDFYERMNHVHGRRDDEWRDDALKCAAALRLYAAKYHAPAKPERNFARELYDIAANGTEVIKESAKSEELTWA